MPIYYFYGFGFLGGLIIDTDSKEEESGTTDKIEIENRAKNLLNYFYEQIYSILHDPSATYDKVCEKFKLTACIKVVENAEILDGTYILEYDHNMNIINKFYENSEIVN